MWKEYSKMENFESNVEKGISLYIYIYVGGGAGGRGWLLFMLGKSHLNWIFLS